MGGISASYADPQVLNFSNPASLSFLNATAFDFGMVSKYVSQRDPVASAKKWSGNLGYMGLAFPLRNPLNELFSRQDYKFNWGMGFSLTPHSNVSYDVISQDSLEGIGNFERQFVGSGSLYKVMWSNSVRINNLSFGINLGYLFGRLSYSRKINYLDEFNAFNTNFSNSYFAKGAYWKGGVIYKLVLNKEEVRDKLEAEVQIISIWHIRKIQYFPFHSCYYFSGRRIYSSWIGD